MFFVKDRGSVFIEIPKVHCYQRAGDKTIGLRFKGSFAFILPQTSPATIITVFNGDPWL